MSSKNLINIDNCISELDFISSIPKNHKPCYRSKTTVSTKGWFVTAKRRWNGEKGEYGVVYVNKVLDDCETYYRTCILGSVGDNYDRDNNPILSRLLETLRNSVVGFDNLIDTYDDQRSVSNDYQLIKDRVNDLIKKLNNYYGNDNIMVKSLIVRNPKSNFFNTDNIVFVKNK